MASYRTIGPENDPKIPGRTSTPEDVTTTFRRFLWYAMFEAPEWHPSDQPEQAAEELNVKIQQSFPVTKVFLSMKIVEVKRHLTFELCRFCIVTVTYILDFHQEELEESSTYINILNAGVSFDLKGFWCPKSEAPTTFPELCFVYCSVSYTKIVR